MTTAGDAIAQLYRDVQRCAVSAGLSYVGDDLPGISRLRRGKGFSYRGADGALITDVEIKQRLAGLAIPRPGARYGSAPTPTVTCSPPERTTAAASNTCTTRAGASCVTS